MSKNALGSFLVLKSVRLIQRTETMALHSTHKKSILTSLVLLLGSHASLVLADNGGYYMPPNYDQAPSGYNYGGYPAQRNYDQGNNFMTYGNSNRGYNDSWDYQVPDYNYPQNYQSSGFNAPWNNNNSGFSAPWDNRGTSFSGPWNNRGSSFSGPWNNRGSGFSAPWDNGGWGNGGRNPFGNRGPSQWMNPNKNDFSNNWDDMQNAPSRMGRMPGGWNAPSVSVPNPIDVGDEFGDAARDMPDQMDNFRYTR